MGVSRDAVYHRQRWRLGSMSKGGAEMIMSIKQVPMTVAGDDSDESESTSEHVLDTECELTSWAFIVLVFFSSGGNRTDNIGWQVHPVVQSALSPYPQDMNEGKTNDYSIFRASWSSKFPHHALSRKLIYWFPSAGDCQVPLWRADEVDIDGLMEFTATRFKSVTFTGS